MTLAWQHAAPYDATDRSILILEDNETLALGLRTSLEIEGYTVECVTDGKAGLAWLEHNDPDLIVLDLMLPGLNGFEVLRGYRNRGGSAAVLILSARDQEVDKVQGFRIGADDYVVKPVGVLEFLARVEAIIRRLTPPVKDSNGENGARKTPLRFGDVVVDPKTRTVLRAGKPVELSPMEFDFLAFMIETEGNIISRDTLMSQVWHYSIGVTSRTVDQHVARLRNKLEHDPAQPRHFITVRKAGYRFQR